MTKNSYVQYVIQSLAHEPDLWKAEYLSTRDGHGHLSEIRHTTGGLVIECLGSIGLRKPDIGLTPWQWWKLRRAVHRWLMWQSLIGVNAV